MSKLYNTLEKIRTGEQGGFPERKSAPATRIGLHADTGKKRLIILLGASVFLALGLVVFFSGSKHKETKPPATAVTATAVTPARIPDTPAVPAPKADDSPQPPPAPPVSPATAPSATGNELYRQLNDTGVALIQKNQHWQGIYYLEQARKQQPERAEALINMAVALAELGLRAPAKRVFSEAHALAPNNPLLRTNLELLEQADFLDPQWLSTLTAGQSRPGQTSQPK